MSGGRRLTGDAVAVGFMDVDSVERQELIEDCAHRRFELGPPVRSFPSYRGQRNWPGWWWSATSGAHVGYESWLERDQAMSLDFSPDVVAFAAQPFWLFFPVDGQRRSHAVDVARLRRRDPGLLRLPHRQPVWLGAAVRTDVR